MKRNSVVRIAIILSYAIFIALSWVFVFGPGIEISHNFASFSLDMLKVLPCAFILIGLFEIWVKRKRSKGISVRNLVLDGICREYSWQAPQSAVCTWHFLLPTLSIAKERNSV